MILGSVQEHIRLAPQQSHDKSGAHLSGKRIQVASVCLAMAGVLLSAPSAFSQNASTPDVPVQHSTCASDPQGLMCNFSQRDVNSATTAQITYAANATTIVPALSDAQMERLSDVLLGLLYFVLPIGFGLALFLHDRYEAYRAATLEAQIELLEKLWKQTPQA